MLIGSQCPGLVALSDRAAGAAADGAKGLEQAVEDAEKVLTAPLEQAKEVQEQMERRHKERQELMEELWRETKGRSRRGGDEE